VNTAKNIPQGSQCESVQLVPFQAIGKRLGAAATTLGGKDIPSAADNMQFQFPAGQTMMSRSMGSMGMLIMRSQNRRVEKINNFI